MSSQRQIEANRRNSQLSTGPRTPEGKAVSCFNALQSGVHAQAQVIPGEDPAELEAVTAGYHQHWAPATNLECFLVDSLIRADWLLRRLARLEAQLWNHEIDKSRKSLFSKLDENAPLGEIYGRTCDRFTRLQRRIDSTERSYYRALTQLQRLRAGDPAPRVPCPVPAPPQPDSPTPNPEARGELGSFGTVPQTPAAPAPPPSESDNPPSPPSPLLAA